MKARYWFLALLFVPLVASARGYHHRSPTPPKPTPAPAPAPVPAPTTTIPFGFYLPPSGVPNSYTMEFTDGAFPPGSGNLVIFWEAPYTDSQILAGQSDALLKSFATASNNHTGAIILALGEEVNCDNVDPWGGAYKGNTVASTINAFEYESAMVKLIDPNLKIAFSVNNGSCYGEPSAASYYPGNSFVDLVGIDGFDFGGQSWASVFDQALTPLQSIAKPLWILSEGVTSQDNQAQFIKDTFTFAPQYNIQGIMYFNQSPFNLNSSALTTLTSLL